MEGRKEGRKEGSLFLTVNLFFLLIISSIFFVDKAYAYGYAEIATPYYSNGNVYVKGTLTTDRLLRWSLKDFGYSRVLLIPRGGEYKSDKIARLLGYPQTGYFDFTVNNSGYSLQYNHFYLETYWDKGYFDYATQSLSSGDWTSVTMIIPHGTSLDPNTSWLKRVSYEYTYTKGRERDTNQVDISAYVSHVKYCTGGSWQSNSTQHWKQCGTCGYVGSGRVNHTWQVVSYSTCTSGGVKRCTACGRTETSPALGHSWDNNTWYSDGWNHWHRCTRCGATKDVAAHNWAYSNVNATTHDKACTVCAYKITGEAHSFVNNKCACGRYNTVVVSFDLNLPTPEDGETLKIGPNPSSIAPITYTYGDRYLDAKYNLTVPKLADYSFVGWYTQKTGGEFIRISTTVSNSNAHTLYAQWVPNKINIQKLESKNIEVIENNGQNENDYKRDHAENGILNYDYSDTMITFGAEMIAKEEAEAEIPIVNDENNAANLSSWMTNAINKTGESVNNGVITFSWTADNTQDTVSPYGSLRHGVHARTYTIPGNTYKLEFDYMVSNPTPMVIGIENGGLIRTTPKANEWIHFEKEFTALNKQQDYENCYYNNLVFYTGDSTSQTLNIKNVKCGIMEAEAGLPDSYTYIWESKLPEGEWKQLDLKGVTGDKLNLIVKNATRDNNKAKIRLTVKNNAGDSITSNEATMTVYYLPEIE